MNKLLLAITLLFLTTIQIDAQSFDQPIGDWNTGSVTTMARMFNGAVLFNQDISGWNTSKVTTTYRMFFNAHMFNQPLNDWNINSQNVS